jgi:hypothetical protein
MSLEKFHPFLTIRAKRWLAFGISFWLLFSVAPISFAFAEGDDLQPEGGDITSSPALAILFDILLLAGTLICFLISLRVKSFLRDGELASGWTLFSLSFVLLFIAQLLSFLLNSSLFNISYIIISSVRLLAILSLASGIYFMKKVLS